MNKVDKRALKESNIIDVAEKVFAKRGFDNTKMEDIAADLGISKGTVYFYFNSKENLYMAITYRAYEKLIQTFKNTIKDSFGENGLETIMNVMRAFMDFSEQYYIYSEALLNYFSFVRRTGDGVDQDKLTEGMKESVYYQKVLEIQTVPVEIAISQIQRGIEDGSIKSVDQPQLIYLNAWALVIGFLKLNDTSATNRKTILRIDVNDWKENILQNARSIIEN